MKTCIKILSDSVVNKIAAGEIVERPMSVVRELVDNSIDAGASEILVELEDGGLTNIRVSDNGSGMSPADLKLSLHRHATSKITSAEDLSSIETLGFRGEALASIASVSKLKIRTRRKEDESGIQLLTEAGKKQLIEAVAANQGTSIEVKSLFYNTPARRKFLKKPKTEEIKVKQWLLQYAVGHPEVRFRMLANAKEQVNLPSCLDSIERAKSLIEGDCESITQEFGTNLKISGCFGHPGSSKLAVNPPVILVNGRLVQDKILSRAIRDAYQSMLKPSEKPNAIVCIQVNPKLVDVNVHPQKSEVRFVDSQSVFRSLRETVTRALSGSRAPVTYAMAEKTDDAYISQSKQLYNSRPPDDFLVRQQGFQNSLRLVQEDTISAEADSFNSEGNYSNVRYVGQVLDCFLICERGEEMIAIDMHAAHERINFNKIRNQYKKEQVSSQNLLVGLSLDLNEEELERLKDSEYLFETFGFKFDFTNDVNVVVKAAPSALSGGNIITAIKEACGFEEDLASEGALSRQIDHVAARIACHASVRSGKKLKEAEVYQLLNSLDSEEFAAACPHGRPVAVTFSRYQLEKWFGRDK